MKDIYFTAFFDIVKETQDKHGYELPLELEQYVVMLLSYHIDRPGFLPESTFAESFLKIHEKKLNAKELGDTCLFVTGVFPTYGSRHGLSRKYYSEIGQSSYQYASELMNGSLFSSLALHFEFLSNFIELTVSDSSRHGQNTLYR